MATQAVLCPGALRATVDAAHARELRLAQRKPGTAGAYAARLGVVQVALEVDVAPLQLEEPGYRFGLLLMPLVVVEVDSVTELERSHKLEIERETVAKIELSEQFLRLVPAEEENLRSGYDEVHFGILDTKVIAIVYFFGYSLLKK